MPSSSRSRDQATACANTPPSSRKTYTPMPRSTRSHQNAAAVLRNNQSVSNMPDFQPHTIRRTAEYSAPTFKENSAPFDNRVVDHPILIQTIQRVPIVALPGT